MKRKATKRKESTRYLCLSKEHSHTTPSTAVDCTRQTVDDIARLRLQPPGTDMTMRPCCRCRKPFQPYRQDYRDPLLCDDCIRLVVRAYSRIIWREQLEEGPPKQ